MGHTHTIIPYHSMSEDERVFEFGMTPQQVANLDSKIYEIKEDTVRNWRLERRGGYNTEFIDDKLIAVGFRIDPSFNSFEIDNVDITNKEGIEELKAKYEHYVYADGESTLFPKLGLLVSITPFCDGWSSPRPGVFNREIVAFSKELLDYYRYKSQVLILDPMKGVSIAGDDYIEFRMRPEEIHNLWKTPEYTWKNYGSHQHIIEYYFNHGVELKYRDYEVSYKYSEDMPLYDIELIESNGWQVEVDGIRIFQDDKLIQMKEKYEYIESKKKKAVAFPTLGIFTMGCGDKKNNRKGAEGKVIYLCNEESIKSFIRYIDMWD